MPTGLWKRRNWTQLVEAVRLAPSASNAQPWKVIMVDEPVLRARDRAGDVQSDDLVQPFRPAGAGDRGADHRADADHHADRRVAEGAGVSAHRYRHRRRASLFAGGGPWPGHVHDRVVQRKKIRTLLGIPRSVRIGLLVTIGYPSDGYPIRPKVRKEPGEIAGYNTY